MLKNYVPEAVENHVKFIEYTGKWPSLCCGRLTLEIDGETATFGNSYSHKDAQYDSFWSSAARLDNGNEWSIDVNDLPEKFRKYAVEIDHVFNENVEAPCCGGCK